MRPVPGELAETGHLHFNDALWQVGRDLRQALSPAVHDVIAAGAGRRAGDGVGIAGWRLRVGACGARAQWSTRAVSGAEWVPGPLHRLPNEAALHGQLLGKGSPAGIVRILQTQLPLATHSARRRDAALDLTISGLFHLLCQPITLIF